VKIALILKGNISRRQEFEGELSQLRANFPHAEISVLESTYAGHSRALAEASCTQCDYMVAVGGDGTLNEVLNGCLGANADLPCLGALAHGTANDMLRSLHLKGTMDELCTMIRDEQERTIDIGRVICRDDSGAVIERHFINIADIGIGAEVVQHLNQQPGLLGSNLHYLRAILKTFAGYQKRELSITSDCGLKWQGKTLAMVAANGQFFGSGLSVAPGAALNDGQLFITLVGDASLTDFALNLRRLKKGTLLDHPEASYHHARRLEVKSTGEHAPLEVDGEFLGFTPATIEVLPQRVRFLGPPDQ
jgi:YegS/Rv2252/BmrU family lipid kinase